MSDNLKFKQGLYKNISNLSNGDIGFAQFDSNKTEGTLVLKSNNKIFHLMPAPGTSATVNMPLVNTGANTSPEYKTLPIEGGGTGATSAADALKNLGLTATATELNYTDGVTSNIQTQLNGKVSLTGNETISGIKTFRNKSIGAFSLAKSSSNNGSIASATDKLYHIIDINSTSPWMLAFTVRMYQSYRYTDIVISGYNYSATKTWHSPTATILGTSATTNEDIIFGNYSNNLLWVAIPAGNYYGIDIIDVTSGLNDQVSDYSTLFTIKEGTLPNSALEAKTITAYAPWYRDETVTNATNATKLTTNAGSTYAPIYFTGGIPKQCTSPSMIVNLSSNNASSIFLQSPKPGVTGVLSITNGGTGATTAAAARTNLGAASITFITWGEDDTYATIDE